MYVHCAFYAYGILKFDFETLYFIIVSFIVFNFCAHVESEHEAHLFYNSGPVDPTICPVLFLYKS